MSALVFFVLCGTGYAQKGPPTLISFAPAQAAAGSSVTLTFNGTNFAPRSMQLIFNPSQGITVTNLQVVSPMQISAQVQIAASAQPGNRQVILVDADHNLNSPTPFTITAATPPTQPCTSALTPNGACPTQPQPAIREFSPLQGTQGSNVAMTITGASFSPPAALQFMPGSGITVQSATVTNANTIQAQLSIAPNASLGARGVVLVIGSGKTRVSASNTFTVVSGVTIAHMLPMQILRAVPNQISAGSQNVDVTLQGVNFVPGTQVTFTVGAGVPAAVFANGPARYVNSTEIHISVSALPAALPGGRDINLQASGQQQSIVGKGMLNVLAAKQSGLPTALKIAPITLQRFPLGIIHLDGPLGPATQSDQYVTYGVPMLNDDSVFQWHEQNPGLADYYELRIYAQDGKTLLATKQITGYQMPALNGLITVVPTYYRPDPAFLESVLEPVQRALYPNLGVLLGPASISKTPVLNPASAGVVMPNFPPDQLSGLLSQGNLQWEVAGFHTYNKNGVAPQTNPQAKVAQNALIQNQSATQNNAGQNSATQNTSSSGTGGTVDLEVEISDRWPLLAPKPPTGMQCNGTGFTTGGVQTVNIADKNVYDANGKVTGVDPNNYIGDPWALEGNINLANSPYQIQFTPQTSDPPNCGSQCLVKYVSSVQFDNVFVDWGDGTVQPLVAPPVEPPAPNNYSVYNWTPNIQLSLPMNYTSPMQHTYQSPNAYTVRVFQLSEEDLQNVSVSSVSASVDGPTTPYMQTALLSKMAATGAVKNGLTLTGVQTNFAQLLSGGGNATTPASQAASDAYMLYCHTVLITVPEDLAADGPLHLKGIANPDFGAYDVQTPKLPANTAVKGLALQNLQNGGQSTPQNKTPAKIETMAPITAANNPQQPAAQPKEGKEIILPLTPGQVPIAAICSTCDDGMDATSYLSYYGTGPVKVTWIVDGTPTAPQTFTLPPSPPRKNLTRQGYTSVNILGNVVMIPTPEPPIIIGQSNPLDSPGLQVQPVGNHSVMVEADVMPNPTMPNLGIAVSKALGSLMPSTLSPPAGSNPPSSGKQASAAPNLADAQSLLATLAPPTGSNLPPLKIGVLSPSNQSASGLGAVQYVNGALQQVIAQATNPLPDQHVASNTEFYEVTASDPKKPCKFLFPVKSGGAFEISGLQKGVTQQGTTYNGTGNLIIHFANSSSQGYDQYPPIPVKISNWVVPDGLHVQTGTINVSPNLQLAASLPALTGTLTTLSGQAGGELDATLNVTLADDTLRLPGEKAVSWNGVTSELKANGDWIKNGLTLPLTMIGWSSFTMQSNSVRLDLSHNDGDNAGPLCGNLAGGDWVGVRFPSLAITPYTMDLVSTSSLQPVVNDWGITGRLCGALSTGPFTATLGLGSVSFQSINATAFNGNFTATYNGMDIYVPWIDVHLKGNASLVSGGGKQASISFPFNVPPVSKTYGNFAFTANNLQFMTQQGIGWVVQANKLHMVFSAENKQFAAFDQVFYFGMDGRGYFANANQTADIPLGGSSTLGQTPVDLVSVHLTAPPQGSQVLGALFSTNVHLSEVMAAAPVQVNYQVNIAGNNYTTVGPTNSPFTIEVPYPSGQPASDAKVHPVYSGTSGSEFSGTVDLSEVGGPPITGEFRLGYQGGHDYWLTRVSYPLGPTGLVLIPVPPVMNLYRVQGGLGHNFPISAFEDTGSLSAATPSMDGSFLFMAGMRVGMPDQFTYTVDGDLVIEAGGQNAGARLDFHAWLLKPPDNSNGDFQGYFQYAGNNFDGRVWGQLNFMGGLASVNMGNSASNAAVDIHFGPSGPWHIDAGKQQGPRIDGHLLVSDANMYVMLSGDGLSIGGGESINLDVGDDSVASAYVRGSVDMGLTVTSQPHISGDFSASVEAGVCVDNVCVSAGVSAQVHAEALPLEMDASASIGLPWPLGSVSFSVHL
ncbi:MAG TPA: hypothetical protein VEE85_01735 [Candidatus Bathyarchaeia archaeon]|nr:hypothetical protein [Candidatus Bathyarchaeia archaeon]